MLIVPKVPLGCPGNHGDQPIEQLPIHVHTYLHKPITIKNYHKLDNVTTTMQYCL